jgi:hypothetical protein
MHILYRKYVGILLFDAESSNQKDLTRHRADTSFVLATPALTSRRIEPHKVIGSSGSRRRGGPVEADWGSVFFQPNCLRYLGDLIHGIMMEKVSNEQIRI